jgi:hypothetical protein
MRFELIGGRCKGGIKSRAAPQPVYRFESAGGDQPGPGFFGKAVSRPRIERGSKSVVRSFLRQIETAE